MEPKSLEVKTLDELRALARTAGLRGYTGLRKKQLIQLLAKPKAPTAQTKPQKKPEIKAPRQKTAKARGATPVRKKIPQQKTTVSPNAGDAEQHIESAKFEMTPPQTAFKQTFAPSLHEDIENLPPPGESVLCLLPQKPGVVHAYWTLQPGANTKPLRLRLCYAAADSIELLEEVDVREQRGHWYFSVPENASLGAVFGHLGYYDAGGHFVTAIERGIARIPALYASGQVDSAWWISDQDFQAMYKRAGGVARGKQLYWAGSSSSSSRHK